MIFTFHVLWAVTARVAQAPGRTHFARERVKGTRRQQENGEASNLRTNVKITFRALKDEMLLILIL